MTDTDAQGRIIRVTVEDLETGEKESREVPAARSAGRCAMAGEQRACADCGARMVAHWRGIVLTTGQARYPIDWRCHLCGRVEPAGSVAITTGTQKWEVRDGG